HCNERGREQGSHSVVHETLLVDGSTMARLCRPPATKSTGQPALVATRVAVDPRFIVCTPDDPCVPITIRAADTSRAWRTISTHASPRRTRTTDGLRDAARNHSSVSSDASQETPGAATCST